MPDPATWGIMRLAARQLEPLASGPGYVSTLTRQDDEAHAWTLPGDDPFVMVEKAGHTKRR
jgi:hypothetical protein